MSDYPKSFEDIWLKPVPARTGNRKEAGFVVYCRMKTKIDKLEAQLREANWNFKRIENCDHSVSQCGACKSLAKEYLEKYELKNEQ